LEREELGSRRSLRMAFIAEEIRYKKPGAPLQDSGLNPTYDK
jgi:hypothetical protein